MKKSFKKVVAILLAVLMMVCSFPLTALAADGTRANIKLQFGSVTNSATNIKNYAVDRNNSVANFSKYTGMNSNELTYSNGAISGYETGDFFTISVLVENISQISATEIAVKYSDAIEPAFIKNADSGIAPAIYTDDSKAPYKGFGKLEAITAQSGDAIYNTTHTVGETSYIDAEKRVMHANFAVQTGADAIDLTTATSVGKYSLTNSAIIATFMFKIVNSNAITFSIDTASDTYHLDTIANGGKVDQYKTYAPKVAEDASTAELDFMGKNEHVGSTTQTYTITFVDADGQQISSEYEEGAAVIAPQLPAVTHDDAQHYTYAWDKEIPATATADGTYTIIKTGAAHTWDAGVTTKEPTATEAGEKTFTCTFNGCGATRKEELPKVEETHQHTWSEWKYNNDAVYNRNPNNAKDGTATRTCTDPNCPTHATETKQVEGSKYLGFYGKTVTLGASVALNLVYDKTLNTKFDQVYAEILYSGEKYKLDEVTSYNGQLQKFTFDKIAPKDFDKPLKLTLYAVTSDGMVCKSDVLDYSIKTYIFNQLSRSPTKNLKKLLIETLYYGEEDQAYNNLSKTLTNDLSAEQKAIHTTEVPTYVNVGEIIDNPNPTPSDISWTGMTLTLAGAVYVTYRISVPAGKSISDYNFKFTLDGITYTYNFKNNPDCFRDKGNNVYFIDFKEMGSHQYGSVIKAIAYDVTTGVQASPTRVYSAETYTYSNAYKGLAPLRSLVDQMLRYGRANIAYRAAPNA